MKRPATLLLWAALAAAASACASSGAPGTSSSPATRPNSEPPVPEAAPAPAQPGAESSPRLPSYTAEQADRGHVAFRETCYECHYSSEFKGSDFQYKWGRRSVADLYENIVENMPDDDPGSLTPQQYVDVVAYILELNGFPPGSAELPADEEVMAAYMLKAPNDQPAR